MLGVHLHIGLGCELEHLVVSDGALWVGSINLWAVRMIYADVSHPVFHDSVCIRVVVVGCHETGIFLTQFVVFFFGLSSVRSAGADLLLPTLMGLLLLDFPGF